MESILRFEQAELSIMVIVINYLHMVFFHLRRHVLCFITKLKSSSSQPLTYYSFPGRTRVGC